jgi:hypothetical protein
MFKQLFLATVLLLTRTISFGQASAKDYQVYAAIIKSEIRDSTKSVAIIKNSIGSAEKNHNTFLTAGQLTSNNLSDRYQVYLWTENNKTESPSTIDSNSTQFLIDYCKVNIDKLTLTNSFNQPYKTVIIKKFPIRRKFIQQDWNAFYEKYPGSGGIFSFSKIKYYTQDTTAIVYYWVRRNGLNGHGALAILTKNSGEWQMKYKTYLWHN